MTFLAKFTKLMKSAPESTTRRAVSHWSIDESKFLSLGEVTLLHTAAKGSRALGIKEKRFSLVRDWFVVELGLNAGLRVAEMATLRHQDLLIDGQRSSLKVLGKGKKKRPVWIASEFKATCEAYAKIKAEFGYSVDSEGFVLNNLKGERISKRALQKSFKKLIALAGLGNRYSIHCLRHTYTTFLLKASNHDYRFAQRQLGHASIRTTQVYAGLLESENRDALARMYR
jgi:site-specific recombinase XerC